MVTPVRKTVRIPLAPARDNSREYDTSGFAAFSNCILDTSIDGVTGEKTTFATKRPGIQGVTLFDNSGLGYGSTAETGNQGLWLFHNFIILINNNKAYYWEPFVGVTPVAPTLLYTFATSAKYDSGSSYSLWTKFGEDFQGDFSYGATLFLRDNKEDLYITNGVEDVIIHYDTTTELPVAGVPYDAYNNFVPSAFYKPGDKVVATTYAGQVAVYVCIGEAGEVAQASTEPTWPTTGYDEVTSGDTTWTRLRTGTSATMARSYTNRAYALGDLVKPSVETGYYYIVTTAGTTTAEPTWTEIKNDTCEDSGVVFECLGNYGGKPGLANPSSPVYLDTYIILAAYKTSDIYHSDPADVQSWNPLNFISADSFTSPIVCLQRYNNYVLALGNSDAELFYNNANASGSTLSRHESFLLQVGIAGSRNITGTESIVSWIGSSISGAKTIWLLDGFEPREISNPWINRLLDQDYNNDTNYKASTLRVGGHLYLLFPYKSLSFTGWLVFDVNFKQWYTWWFDTTELPYLSTNNFMDYVAADKHSTYMSKKRDNSLFLMSNDVAVDKTQSVAGVIATVAIEAEIRTLPADFGTQKRKFLHSLDVISNGIGGDIGIGWSEGIAKAWSSPPDFTTTIAETTRARVAPCGSFRRRSFNIYHGSVNGYMRVEALELVYTEGRV